MWRVIAVFGRPVDTFLFRVLTVVCSLGRSAKIDWKRVPLGPVSNEIFALRPSKVQVVCGVVGECPQDVQMQADSCFTDYSAQFLNMRNSPLKMCCGVDVETLRAFCSAYMRGMRCYKELKRLCPADRFQPSGHTRMNIKGAEEGLDELCSDDNIYEKYARHQNCFTNQGHVSEQCLATYINNSVRLMSTVHRTSSDELCRDMRNALNCIKPNIQAICGSEAAKLVEILIKPMVRGTGKCDYNIIHIESTEKPQQHQPSRTQSSMDDKNKYITDNGNGASSLMTSQGVQAAFMVLLCVILMRARQ